LSPQIVIERDGRLARVIISQPARRNALTQSMAIELRRRFDELGADGSVGCILLRGAGEQAFCAGADISEFGERRGDPAVAREFDRVFQSAADGIGTCPHPVIAQIQGACVGGGLQLAMQCDLRICGASSRFGVPVSRLGLAAAWGELEPMVHLAGAAFTLEVLLEGTLVDAARAERSGLVNRVVADDAVDSEARAAAERILAGAPLVARWHKRFVRRLLEPRPLEPAEIDEAYACFATADYREGYETWLAKTKPRFTGR